MVEQSISLREYPQIIELLAVLEQNGLVKERDEVSSLVEYIGSMEDKISQMMGELQQMHGEVKQIQDKGLSARCTRLLDTAQEKVTQTGEMVSTVKNNFVRAAGTAVKTFKEKGCAALVQAVRAMKIPVVLSKMENAFHAVAQSMQDAGKQVDTKREQLHEAGGHLKNVGRALSGKAAKEIVPLDSDKGILAKVRSFFERMENTFSAMGDRAGELADKFQSGRDEKKASVKTELHALKSRKSAKKSASALTEQVR
uniref:DUF6674 family protein n=1 Tax=Enterocloster clostridioformis TaxID=1531 RepID=UPI001C3D0668|nr:DUF6674 family protein [Enterocloster clostridioformis]